MPLDVRVALHIPLQLFDAGVQDRQGRPCKLLCSGNMYGHRHWTQEAPLSPQKVSAALICRLHLDLKCPPYRQRR